MRLTVLLFTCALLAAVVAASDSSRPRVREFGLKIGILNPGRWNAITDVKSVRVGQVTLVEGTNVRTGVTVIVPHEGNVFLEKTPAAVEVENGFGKLAGSTQIEELGNIETPIVLTNTLSVPIASEAVIDYVLALPGCESVLSVNPIVGETNDGRLNDIRRRHVRKEHVLQAIRDSKSGPVQEGAVGAGTGTVCFGFKGGVGTSSRVLPRQRGGYTVGVLVQTNFGGVLTISGNAVGVGLGNYPMKGEIEGSEAGSCMIVAATDAPLDSRNLKRLAKRALLGIARTGGYYANGSGDYAIAFSTAAVNRVKHSSHERVLQGETLSNEAVSPLFLAAAEATEEAILNSLFKAETMEGQETRVEALPLDKLRALLAGAGK